VIPLLLSKAISLNVHASKTLFVALFANLGSGTISFLLKNLKMFHHPVKSGRYVNVVTRN
jgi:hypothetical protein